jgi:hypothetical protein
LYNSILAESSADDGGYVGGQIGMGPEGAFWISEGIHSFSKVDVDDVVSYKVCKLVENIVVRIQFGAWFRNFQFIVLACGVSIDEPNDRLKLRFKINESILGASQ